MSSIYDDYRRTIIVNWNWNHKGGRENAEVIPDALKANTHFPPLVFLLSLPYIFLKLFDLHPGGCYTCAPVVGLYTYIEPDNEKQCYVLVKMRPNIVMATHSNAIKRYWKHFPLHKFYKKKK